MKYAEWNALSAEDKKSTHWKHHPRMRIATIFSILFAIVFFVFLLRVMQNRRVHVNRKPNVKEALTIAETLVKEKLKQPATASFPNNGYQSSVDTGRNLYILSSTVNSQDSSGKMFKSKWAINLSFKGGDWAERKNWEVNKLTITQ